MVSSRRRKSMRKAHAKHAYYCTCGKTVRGNGAKWSHREMHRRLGEDHHYCVERGNNPAGWPATGGE